MLLIQKNKNDEKCKFIITVLENANMQHMLNLKNEELKDKDMQMKLKDMQHILDLKDKDIQHMLDLKDKDLHLKDKDMQDMLDLKDKELHIKDNEIQHILDFNELIIQELNFSYVKYQKSQNNQRNH